MKVEIDGQRPKYANHVIEGALAQATDEQLYETLAQRGVIQQMQFNIELNRLEAARLSKSGQLFRMLANNLAVHIAQSAIPSGAVRGWEVKHPETLTKRGWIFILPFITRSLNLEGPPDVNDPNKPAEETVTQIMADMATKVPDNTKPQ